jgi:hypothetical protein
MTGPFESSRRKVAWAKKNIPKLNGIAKEFVEQENLHTILSEPDLHKPLHLVHKLRLIKQIPDGLSELTGNIVDDLRAALDHALFGIARIGKPGTGPLNAYFPFAGDAAHFENNLRGRCKDVPEELYPLLRSYEPYKGGSELLWALNEACGANKHGLLIAVGTAGVTTKTVIEGTGVWSMPYASIWDSAKQEMELFTTARDHKARANITVAFYVAFGEIDGLNGKAAIPVLDSFADMVETIINEIEAESMRLGLVK